MRQPSTHSNNRGVALGTEQIEMEFNVEEQPAPTTAAMKKGKVDFFEEIEAELMKHFNVSEMKK